MSLVWLVVVPFVGSAIAAMLPTNARNAEAWLSGAVALFGVVALALLYPLVGAEEVLRYEVAWLPEQGLNFVLRVDGFAWMFAMLVYGIGALVILYARYYMSPEDPVPRFFSFLLAFMGAMLGIVLSGNLIQLVFFWELTSLFSFLLIGYWHHTPQSRDGARMALITTGVGGLALLAGVLIIGHVAGSYDLDVVLDSGRLIAEHDLYVPLLLLVLLGALTKSAQFPFHFWLPRAMAAPTPVSAYLHSATMVKAGVFLMARLWPVLSGTKIWFGIVCVAGLATLTYSAYKAIFQNELKGLLAYSTTSHLGLITLLLGLNSPTALVAAVFHIMNHATFKASLFMAAGVVDHETGTREFSRLGGLARKLPITAALATVASAAMAGVPLLNGFLSKEMFFAETVSAGSISGVDWILPVVATIASVFSVTYSIRFVHGIFFGPEVTDLPREPHEPPRFMRFPIEFLVIACLVVGIIPGIAIQPFLGPAVESILGSQTPSYSLAIWHGVNLPLVMSFVALVGGIVLYSVLKQRLARHVERVPGLPLDGREIFDWILLNVSWRWSVALERFFGTHRLQPQLMLIVVVALLAAYLPLRANGFEMPAISFEGVEFPFLAVWILGALAAASAAFVAKYHRLAALIMMGGAGLIVCVTFVWLSAPDLAITQLLVEVVTLVLLLLGLRWLPVRTRNLDPLPPDEKAAVYLRRTRDVTLAVVSGVGIAILTYAVMTSPLPDTVASYYLANAYSEGGGTNVVNVILVDFRALDTLGEITVLGAVSITVFALLRRFRPAPESTERPKQQLLQKQVRRERNVEMKQTDLHEKYMYIPRIFMHWVFPMIWALAAYLFIRGHDLPGGGFAAGITLAIGFILQYMAGGTRWVEDRLRVLPLRWMALGLTVAVLTGAGAWLFGRPFLTSFFQYTEIPLIGSVPTASALLFDLGVFMLVVGATTLILVALAHQSLRGGRSPHRPRMRSEQEEAS